MLSLILDLQINNQTRKNFMIGAFQMVLPQLLFHLLDSTFSPLMIEVKKCEKFSLDLDQFSKLMDRKYMKLKTKQTRTVEMKTRQPSTKNTKTSTQEIIGKLLNKQLKTAINLSELKIETIILNSTTTTNMDHLGETTLMLIL